MAESQAVAKQALTEKLEDHLTCAICLDAFKDPKLLQCFHVYCKDCLERLVVQDSQGQLSLSCPTCRQSTLLPPATGVSGLQSAFHIRHLFEIQDAVEKLKPQAIPVKVPENVLCEKCTKSTRIATNYCHDCGKYICKMCTDMHLEWEEFSAHKPISIVEMYSQVTTEKVVAMPKEGILYCSLHKGKELDLYCETCEELICLYCSTSKHCGPKHKYEPVEDIIKRHEGEITASIAPVKEQINTATKTLEQIDVQIQDLNDQQNDCESCIQQEIKQFQEMLETRKAELLSQLEQRTQQKMKELLEQKDKVEMAQAQLVSCLSLVKDSARTRSRGELMSAKKALLKQIKEVTHKFDMDKLLPLSHDSTKVKFVAASDEVARACQQFGEVLDDRGGALVSPQKCYATGKGLEMAEIGEKVIATLHIPSISDEALFSSTEFLACKIISESTGKGANCSVKKLDIGRYEVSYKLAHRGRHNLHMKVSGEHIKGSPFSVTAFKRLGTPAIKFIGQGCVKWPWGIAFNQRGDIVVAEGADCCVSLFKPSGIKFLSFGTQGTSEGKFKLPRCVAVDDDGNILVTDKFNCNLQKFTSEGKFITAVMGKTSRGELKFGKPRGIAIHPHNKKVYVVDNHNHCVLILHPDLTFFSRFGSLGSGSGQFNQPYGIVIDSTARVYIADRDNHRIQVFTAEGRFLRQFGTKGRGNGELYMPTFVTVDNAGLVYVSERGNHRISVFTDEGTFLTSFGGVKGNRPEQLNRPRGIAVDDSGVVYICDTENNRLIIL